MTTFTATTARAILFAEVTRLQGIERELGLAKEAQRMTDSVAQRNSKPLAVRYKAKDTIECPACADENGIGTGMYGDDGICYRCGGKGRQTDADQRRNWGYNKYHNALCEAAPSKQDLDYMSAQSDGNASGQWKPAKPAYVPPAPTAELIAMRERMAAAKAKAIASGATCVA